MSLISVLLAAFGGMGREIKIPMNYFNLHLKNPLQFKKLIFNRVLTNKISMIEFKKQIKQMYLEERYCIAEGLADDCLKYIYSCLGVENEVKKIGMLFFYQKLIVADTLRHQESAYDEIMESFFGEIELCTQYSLKTFMSVTMPDLLRTACKKHLIDSPRAFNNSLDEFMDKFCYILLTTSVKEG